MVATEIETPQTEEKPPDEKGKTPKADKKIDYNALTRDWDKLDHGIMLLTGSLSQAHKKFRGYNHQAPAMAIVACAFAYLQRMNSWTTKTIDNILEIGEKLYLRSKQEGTNKCRKNLLPTHINKYFFLGKIQVSMKVEVDFLKIKIFNDRFLVDNMVQHMRRFLEMHTFGIFSHNLRYFTFWRYYKNHFLFDSTEHDKVGEKWTGVLGLGFATLGRFPNLELLVEHILKFLTLKHENFFTIYPVHVEKYARVNTKPPETIEDVNILPPSEPKSPKPKPRKIKEVEVGQGDQGEREAPPEGETVGKALEPAASEIPPKRPKLDSVTNFQELAPGSGILRASTHQNDPRFTKYQGAQGFANALSALTMLRVYKSKQWHRDILNTILKTGETIHHDIINLPAGEMPNSVTIEEKKFQPKIKRYHGGVGCLTSSEPNILSLEEALTNHFLDNDCTILFGPSYILPIWKEENRFYYFDPNECDQTGRLVHEQNGVACVLWFTELKNLVGKILTNVPGILHKARFTLGRVVINDAEERADDWYNFRALTLDKWILRGSFCQKDRRFAEDSRNVQCTAMATLALAYKELKEEKEWESDTIDKVLIIGDDFYRQCVDYLREKDVFKDAHLMVDEVKRSFDLENKKVNLEIDDCLVNGVINAGSETGIPNLKKGFEEFFTESEAGIVTANNQSMAVWKRGDAFYYYDSHSRDRKGIVCAYGTACLLRLLTIDELTKMLLTNLGADRQNLYNISRIVVKMIDLTEDGVVKPPLNNYSSLSDNVAILRSNWSEKDPKFEINSGKQTVPNCLVALAMNLLLPSNDWRVEDLDQVLIFGDKLYTKSMGDNLVEDAPPEANIDQITTNNVKKDLKIGANRFEVELEDYSSGNLEDLKQAGESFAQSILESEFVTAALWQDENSFYLFDPKPRDENGQVYGKDDWSVRYETETETEGEADQTSADENEESDVPTNPFDDPNIDHFPPWDDSTPYNTEEEVDKIEETTKVHTDFEEYAEQLGEGGDFQFGQVEKKGSEFWRQQEVNGKACVLRFSRIEDLLDHILDNAPPNRISSIEYNWKIVKVSNTPVLHEIDDPEAEEKDEMVGDWNNFIEIDRGRWILRSKRTMDDALFLNCNKGKQAIPICIVALSVASYYTPSKYTQEVVDSIVTYGDRLYTVVRRKRAKELKMIKDPKLSDEEIEDIVKNTNFDLIHYPNQICIWRKLFSWTVELGLINGDTTSTIPDEVPNVPSALEKFFQDHSYGILECNSYPVSIFQRHDFFYMFDPHKCGPSGHKSPLGVSCMTRFSNLVDLSDVYLTNVPKIGTHFFVIHSLSFTHDRCPIGWPPEPPIETLPKVGGFAPVMMGKQILRGSTKLTCKDFTHGVNIYSSTVAIVALTISICKHPVTWTKIMIDEIMKVAQELFTDTVEKLGDKFDTWGDTLKIEQVNPDFRIGTLKANWVMRCKEQKGLVDVKNSKIANLRQGLERFFEENTRGILLIQRLILGVWEQEEHIYLFDPNSRSATGLPIHGGYPCVVRFWNIKLVAEHVMACLLEGDKAKVEYLIVPLEIVVGKVKSGRKKSCFTTTKTSRLPSPIPYDGTPLTCPHKMTLLEQQRAARQLAQRERCAKEQNRIASLGRSGFYKLHPDEWIIRGARPLLEHRDVAVNYAAFFFLQANPNFEHYNWTHIEDILQIGNLLHIDSSLAYKLPNQKLGFEHVLRKFNFVNIEIKLKIFKPLVCSYFTRANLLYALNCAFTLIPCFLLSYGVLLVTLYFKEGYFYVFDPYGRDLEGNRTECPNGSAMLMKFGSLEGMVEKLVYNLTGIPDQEVGKFALVFLEFEYVRDLLKKESSRSFDPCKTLV